MKWINKKSIMLLYFKPTTMSRLMGSGSRTSARYHSMANEELDSSCEGYIRKSTIKFMNTYSDYNFNC
jgi:hypothetical protein